MHNVIPLNFLQQLNTAHIYNSYEHLAYSLHKDKVKIKHKWAKNLREKDSQKLPTANISPLKAKNHKTTHG